MTTPSLHDAKRIVIKVGSLMIADADSNELRTAWLHTLAHDIAALRAAGKDVLVVSSGAVTLGRNLLDLHQKGLTLSQKQAAASCGQIALANAWASAMEPHGIITSQVLLTAADTEDRRRYLNARQTIDTLLELGVMPVINENDTVTTVEIRYGDNDRLAACVAAMAAADLLVLFSDIDGMYTADPTLSDDAEFIDVIESITPDIEAMAGGSQDHFSTGGMQTKVAAAKVATAAGCHMVIARGMEYGPMQRLLDGERCTWFTASDSPINARKQWIASAANNFGSIKVDNGAERALSKGNSLLPSGIISVEGTFENGDTIEIMNEAGTVLASGITLYPSDDVIRIMGKQSDDIRHILGYYRGDTVIHRDDMVLANAGQI